MGIAVSESRAFEQAEYKAFVERCSSSLIYNSTQYIQAIEQITQPDEIHTLLARQNDRIVGSIVLFVRRFAGKAVLNALPYFGSHGDILIEDEAQTPQDIAAHLASQINTLCETLGIGAINIVSHPLRPHIDKAAAATGVTAWDQRTGQISLLSNTADPEEALATVLRNCHPKTRNLVRKGLRSQFDIEISRDPLDWDLLFEHHRIGMERINGRYKQRSEFEIIRKHLQPSDFCKLYVARKDGEFAGALLNLYYKEWVEYFTPVAVEKYRSDQVLSAIIATAMQHACISGKKFWNWGGTWSSQSGVYHFKKGWGAIDHPYNYFGRAIDDELNSTSPALLQENFPYFYVRPF
jgi:hypothetical protein